MIGFLGRHSGGAININAIQHIGPSREIRRLHGVERRFPVFFKGEKGYSSIELPDYCLSDLYARPVQLVAAEVGARLLSTGMDGDKYYCAATALIAWALCIDGTTRPVTPAGVDDGGDEPPGGWWIELPSGGIYETSIDAAVVADRVELEDLIRRRAASEGEERAALAATRSEA